jgi:hypothetical protein
MTEALLVQNTAATGATVTASDVAISTNNFKPNEYQNCKVYAFVQIDTNASSVTTNNTLKFKLNGIQLTGATWNFKTDAAIRTIGLGLEWVGDVSAGGALTITVAGAGTDANTTFTVKRVYVTAVA